MKAKQLLAFGLVACIAISGCGKKKDFPKPEETSSGTNVKVYNVEPIDIANTVSYTGEIKAGDTNAITAEVSAVVKLVNVENGDKVTRGQLLVELNSTDYQTAYNNALANFNQTKTSQSSALTNAENGVKTTSTSLATAQSNYDREYNLYQQDSSIKLAQQIYDDAVAAYDRQLILAEQDDNLITARNAVVTAEDAYNKTMELYEAGGSFPDAVTQASNTLASARANLHIAEANIQTTLDNLQFAVNKAYIDLETAKTNKGAALENAKNALASAQTAYNNAVSSLASARESSKSAITVAENAMKSAKQNLDKTKIYATSDGYVTSKNVTVGQMAAQGSVVCSIKNVNSVDAEINVTETVIPFIAVGNPATISVKAAGVDNINGTVSMVNATKDEKTGMYTVRVNIPNDDNKINVGMFADITLNTDTVSGAIAIPSEALVQEGEDYFVYIARSNTKAEKVQVEVGVTTKEYTEILVGVEVGDKVIVDGKDYLSETNTDINIIKD